MAQMTRLTNAWRALAPERQLAALASLGLFASMFLPWYDKTDTVVVRGAAKATETSLSAFQAFSFVEAAVLLVSAGVLAMLFERAEGRVFQLPGGDGLTVMIAGGWSALLIFYRLLDKPGLHGNDRVTATVGVEWGIFIALLLALAVAYAGARMRALERPGPPLRRARGAGPRPPADPSAPVGRRLALEPRASVDQRPPLDADTDVTAVVPGRGPVVPGRGRRQRPTPVAARERGRFPPAPPASSPKGEQLSFVDPPDRLA
jgi:hypothetical protein